MNDSVCDKIDHKPNASTRRSNVFQYHRFIYTAPTIKSFVKRKERGFKKRGLCIKEKEKKMFRSFVRSRVVERNDRKKKKKKEIIAARSTTNSRLCVELLK